MTTSMSEVARDEIATDPGPRFSICIPNYNYARYLDLTIRSVLDQSVSNLEILVSDNASTDGSTDVVRRIDDDRIRLRINRRNVGYAGNLDRAASMATGACMIMLSSDDLMRPDALRVYLDLLDRVDPAAQGAVLASAMDVIDSSGRTTGRIGMDRVLWNEAEHQPTLSKQIGGPVYGMDPRRLLHRSLTLLRNPFGFASFCYPRELYRAVEGYGGQKLNTPDKWFAWHVLAEADAAYFVDAPLFAYRWHEANQASIMTKARAPKHLLDQYISTFEISDEILGRAGLERQDVQRAFIEEDVALRGLTYVARGSRQLARQTALIGRAAYPDLMRRNPKAWALRASLALGPLGTQIAARALKPALSFRKRVLSR